MEYSVLNYHIVCNESCNSVLINPNQMDEMEITNVTRIWCNEDKHCIVIRIGSDRYIFFDVALGICEFKTPSRLVDFYADKITRDLGENLIVCYYEPIGVCEKGEIIIFHEWVYFKPMTTIDNVAQVYKRFYEFEFEEWTPVTLVGKKNPDCPSQYGKSST
jgi:hypothetical protein